MRPTLARYEVGYCPPQAGNWNGAERTIVDALVRRAGFVLKENAIVPHVRWERRNIIYLPPRKRWYSTEWRAATLAHEVMHAYAPALWGPDEECIAEMGAILILTLLDMPYPDQAFLPRVGGWRDELLQQVLQRVQALFEGVQVTNDASAE